MMCIALIVAECPKLEKIPGGKIIVSGQSPGSFAKYTCTDKHLNGVPLRTCLDTGEWSGIGPVCQGKIICFKSMQ